MTRHNTPIIQPWTAFISPSERVSLKDAQGRKAASTIRQYPPGIPDILPGMTYSKEIIDRIESAHLSGSDLIGIDMSTDQSVDVVKINSANMYEVDIQTMDSRQLSEDIAIEIADFFRAGFCAAPYFHFAFHESDPLQSLPHTIDFDAYAVSIALQDDQKRKNCQNTLRELAVQRAQTVPLAEFDTLYLPKGFHRWTDKHICREQIKNRLSDRGYVTLVRNRDTSQIVGLLHSRMATVERLFHTEEWSDPLLFSTFNNAALRDDPNRFFEKIKYHFGLNPSDHIMTISAQVLSPEVQGGDVFYNMMRSMARRVRPEHTKLPLLCEIPSYGTAYTLNTAFTDRIVFGVLKNKHPVIYCSRTSNALFPFISNRSHWNYALRNAVRDKQNYRRKYFIPQPTDNQNIIVKPNGMLGLAVYATAFIPSGSRIAIFTGETYKSATALGLPDIMRDHAIQIGQDEFVFGYKGLAHRVCHSCDPNCGIRQMAEIFAVRDISKGEQITWDYRCSENSNWVLESCLCGSARCTGKIGNYDSLPEKFKKEYLSKKMVAEWLSP